MAESYGAARSPTIILSKAVTLFILKPGFAVVRALAGKVSVVYSRTGDALELSSEDAMFLEVAAKRGVDANDPKLATVSERYRALGLLEPSSQAPEAPAVGQPAVAAAEPAPRPPPPLAVTSDLRAVGATPSVERGATAKAVGGPSRNDPVPCLRSTLKVGTKSASSLVQVLDPATGKTFQLYDFELSLARMLDGQRPHAEVVEAAHRIGIPVTFESLVLFIRELSRYGFLAPAGTLPGPRGTSPWPARKEWDEGVRALFQSGLRMYRQGRYLESVAYFEAMLVQDPENSEAVEMLAQAKQRSAAPPAPSQPPLPAVPASTDVAIEQFDELSLDDAPVADAPLKIPIPIRIAHAPQRPRRRTLILLAAAGLIVLAALGWAFIPRPIPLPTLPVVAVPRPPLVADAGGAQAEIDAGTQRALAQIDSGMNPSARVEPAIVDAGVEKMAVVNEVTVDAGPEQEGWVEAATVDAGIEQAGRAEAAMVDAGIEQAGRVEAAMIDDAQALWLVSSISRRARVKMGEVAATAAGIVAWKVEAEQRVKKGELVAVIRTPAGVEKRLVAPVQGLVIPTIAEGATASINQVVGELLYHEAYLQTVVTHARPARGWRCEVVEASSSQRADCTVVTVVPRGTGYFVTAILLPRWFDNAPQPQLRLAPP